MRSQQGWAAVLSAVLGVEVSCGGQQPAAGPAPGGAVEILPAGSAAVTARPSPSVPPSSAPPPVRDAGPPDSARPATRRGDERDPTLALLDGDSHVLDSSESSVDLSRYAEQSCGARLDSSPLRTPTGPTAPAQSTGREVLTPAAAATVAVAGGSPEDARAMVAQRAGVKACYIGALQADPKAPEGRVTLTVVVAASGEVTSVAASASPLPAADVACVTRRIQHARLDPAPSPRTLVVTVDQGRPR